jgi:hypothetical protein
MITKREFDEIAELLELASITDDSTPVDNFMEDEEIDADDYIEFSRVRNNFVIRHLLISYNFSISNPLGFAGSMVGLMENISGVSFLDGFTIGYMLGRRKEAGMYD